MSKIIILIVFLFKISVSSQIKMLENVKLAEVGKDNSVGLYKKENKFIISYQDVNAANLNTIRSFSFQNVEGDLDRLFNLIIQGFTDLPKEDILLELPNDIIELNYEKNYGQPTVQFIQFINKNRKYIGKSQFLTLNQVKKIFGRKNTTIQ
ncbi:hypothetical protein [Chryseobacterium sp.]|uniref:hypothetical protein n=1 Tax=Chryseobacterium sp. TaxID=1871047 RepID=UPI001B2611BF|nr:hypothetical protein [Chryseobacterium sp.]MBO9692936.1 hypothetical protein [Chryseobacterium sp.]